MTSVACATGWTHRPADADRAFLRADHGGGAQSPAVAQLTADIFELPVGRGRTHEASGLGAAIDAAVGLGIHHDIETAVREIVHLGEVRDPNEGDHARYDELYRQVYRRMDGRLQPPYREIRRITGYPPS